MYICSCHAVTDGAVRAAIKSGTKTFAELAKLTGVATQCGICGRQAKALFYQILHEETGVETPPQREARRLAEAADAAAQTPSCAATPCGRAGGCQGCPSFHTHDDKPIE
ncbi:MAG: (2Fe-2S)-binding protein [Candidatus Melainabacteria bacterium]|nr:(2Fe-2S)-binding protein [Candidatus Melainabacteria bacterium]